MVYTTKEDCKTILWGLSTDDKDDAYETVTDKNDVVIFRQLDTGKDFVHNGGEWYEFTEGGGSGGGGGGGGAFIVNGAVEGSTITLDKTWNEINAAASSSSVVIKVVDIGGMEGLVVYAPLTTTLVNSGQYVVACLVAIDSISVMAFTTTSADGYPVAQIG